MISKKMEAALNKQINNEMYSAYLYLAMSATAENAGFKGTANWFRVQAQEEMGHAMKFYKHINDQMGRVVLQGIQEPPAAFRSPLDMFEKALAHEKTVTKNIADLVELAAKEQDSATGIMLQWFVTEQAEEEANATEVIGRLKTAGSNGGAILKVDGKLGERKFGGAAD